MTCCTRCVSNGIWDWAGSFKGNNGQVRDLLPIDSCLSMATWVRVWLKSFPPIPVFRLPDISRCGVLSNKLIIFFVKQEHRVFSRIIWEVTTRCTRHFLMSHVVCFVKYVLIYDLSLCDISQKYEWMYSREVRKEIERNWSSKSKWHHVIALINSGGGNNAHYVFVFCNDSYA